MTVQSSASFIKGPLTRKKSQYKPLPKMKGMSLNFSRYIVTDITHHNIKFYVNILNLAGNKKIRPDSTHFMKYSNIARSPSCTCTHTQSSTFYLPSSKTLLYATNTAVKIGSDFLLSSFVCVVTVQVIFNKTVFQCCFMFCILASNCSYCLTLF